MGYASQVLRVTRLMAHAHAADGRYTLGNLAERLGRRVTVIPTVREHVKAAGGLILQPVTKGRPDPPSTRHRRWRHTHRRP